MADPRAPYRFQRSDEQTLADVDVAAGVVLKLVKGHDESPWEVWAIEIDGETYREPRDLVGDTLHPGPFARKLDHRLFMWGSGG